MMAVQPRSAAVRTPRLLACDIDGTLLDEAGLLRPSVRSAIIAVKAAGIQVVLSTGRSPWAVTDIARQLGLRGPQIVMNGGAFVSPVTCEVGWATRLDRELVIDGLAFAGGLGSSPLLGFLDGHARQRIRPGLAGAEAADGTPDFALGPRLRHADSLESLAGDGPIRIYIPTSPSQHARVRDVSWLANRLAVLKGIAKRRGGSIHAIAALSNLERPNWHDLEAEPPARHVPRVGLQRHSLLS